MARHTRKGRNPGPVDEWLDTLGYYRKNVAYDETCLFRAVSEQMFACQLFHEMIRKECIIYARHNHRDFLNIFARKEDWHKYLDRLEKHMAICGVNEIQIISKTYKKGVLLFDGLNRCMKEVTNDKHSEHLLLCHMGEDHYDVVYKKEYIQDAGFCQSLIYNILYEKVYQIPKVTNIVQAMLYQKPPFMLNSVEYLEDKSNNNDSDALDDFKLLGDHETEICLEMKKSIISTIDEDDKNLNDYEYMLKTNIAPFPFKVAKALDPSIYRNIEYDTWTEMRKEMRLGDWYYGDNNLIQGSGCVLRDNGEDLHCYIQEILKKENRCVVYITSRAEKRIVGMNELYPEADAKPWPLPYRFSKNLLLATPKIEIPDKKFFRKKRDKKRTTSKCSNDSENADNIDVAVSAYEGAPLQMQSEAPTSYEQETAAEISPPAQIGYNFTDWDNSIVPQTPESVGWTQAPTTPQSLFTYNSRTIVPTTPEVYTEPQYYYTPEAYPRYSVWTNGEYVAPLPPDQGVQASPQCIEVPQTPEGFNFYFSDGSYSPACYTPDRQYVAVPSSPQVELYSPVYSAPAPVLLTPADMTEMVLPTPPPPQIIYSPAIEYMPTSPFIYPPTPPAAWYPSPINSQGFIFPTVNPANTQLPRTT